MLKTVKLGIWMSCFLYVLQAFGENGIQLAKWRECLITVAKQCSASKEEIPDIPEFMHCYLPKMNQLSICKQNISLFNQGNVYDIEEIRNYPSVAVIKAKVLMADMSTRLLMMTTQGKIVFLASIKQKDLLQAKPSMGALLKKYPQISVWGMADAFPKVVALQNHQIRLVFKQSLLNGCMACESLGAVAVAYDFDSAGRFLQYHVLKE